MISMDVHVTTEMIHESMYEMTHSDVPITYAP